MKAILSTCALLLAVPMAACSEGKSQDIAQSSPADFGIIVDPSVSHALQTSPDYAKRVAARIREGFLVSDIDLGDRVVIYYLGGRGPGEIFSEVIPIHRGQNKRAVADQLYRKIATIPDRIEGRDYTNLLHVLQNADIRCSDGHGQVWVASDGIPADARDFLDGQHLIDGTSQLPKPLRKPLVGCESLNWIGMGIFAEGEEPISTHGIMNLEQAWRVWSVQAGLSDAAQFFAIRGF